MGVVEGVAKYIVDMKAGSWCEIECSSCFKSLLSGSKCETDKSDVLMTSLLHYLIGHDCSQQARGLHAHI